MDLEGLYIGFLILDYRLYKGRICGGVGGGGGGGLMRIKV